MARPLRIDVAGGWYHVTSRGTDRRRVYDDDRCYEHFCELLAELVERFGLIVHAYVLMTNHYHLLLEAPEENVSPALKWLNGSYSMWYNCREGRVGPLWQGRFKAKLVDGNGSWALDASRYLHLNPVRISGLGLGKDQAAAERRGIALPPSREEVDGRLKRLRAFRWSSYPAYAGYAAKPEWLTTKELLRRSEREGQGSKKRYRQSVEAVLKQGVEPGAWVQIREAVVLGEREFVEKWTKRLKGDGREQPELRRLKRRVGFDEIVKALERIRGEEWAIFRDRHNDIGRDLVMHLVQQRSGLTLREIGEKCGGLSVASVSEAIRRFRRELPRMKEAGIEMRKVEDQILKIET